MKTIDHSRRRLLATGAAGIGAFALIAAFGPRTRLSMAAEAFAVTHSDAEWKAMLSPEQYRVLREQGTETPFSSPLDHEKRSGTFACAGCDLPLFASATKFDSGTGWPSFFRPLPGAVNETGDRSLGMLRTEIHCSRCGGHLGHVFDDGPAPTGLRYCMNGVALAFHPAAA